jgi:CBS domain-containing protein
MHVSTLLSAKGTDVVTVPSGTLVTDVVAVLNDRRIGAAVVSDDGTHIAGIVSERDIVRALAMTGPDALTQPVAAIMTTDVVTAAPDTTIEQLMTTMTDRRVRHVPVTVGGELAGIVSIGDVVKDRIQALELESKALQDYITNPY